MENTPKEPDDSEEQETGKKKKKGAEKLGNFAIEPKRTGNTAREKPESLLPKFTNRPEDASNDAETQEILSGHEASEAEAPLENLSEDEKQFVEREIAMAQQNLGPEQSLDSADIVENAAVDAVETFRGKIIDEGQESDQALRETLQNLEAEDSPEAGSPEDIEDLSIAGEPREFSDIPVQAEQKRVYNVQEPALAGRAAHKSTGSSRRRRPSIFSPTATPAGPSGTGLYKLNTMARGPGAPAVERVPFYDEMTLSTFPGAIVGYLIGRRRGRVKTERKLLPVQKKLEKQVEDLQKDMATKELHIKKVVREKAEIRQKLSRAEIDAGSQKRLIAPEANQLHGKKLPPERIGHVLMSADTGPTETGRQHEVPKKPIGNKQAETMSRTELLDVSEKVSIEETNLRKVYDSHLISERGLRRLVDEHLSGGDVKRALREELLEHEIDFERDPKMRDQAKRQTSSTSSSSVESLLQQTNAVSNSDTEEELAIFKAREAHHVAEGKRQQQRRRAMDASLVTVIVVLLALIIVLFMHGH